MARAAAAKASASARPRRSQTWFSSAPDHSLIPLVEEVETALKGTGPSPDGVHGVGGQEEAGLLLSHPRHQGPLVEGKPLLVMG